MKMGGRIGFARSRTFHACAKVHLHDRAALSFVLTENAIRAKCKAVILRFGKRPGVGCAPAFRSVTWTCVGRIPSSYTLRLDGRSVAEELQGGSLDIDLRKLATGKHVVSLVANGAQTYFDLDARHLTQRAEAPLPVESSIEFNYAL